MRRNTLLSLLVVTAAGFAGYAAVADESKKMEEVTVKAIREEPAGRTTSGAPIVNVTAERRVSFADISLTTDSGVKVMETRIRDAARSACNELEQKYPVSAGPQDCYDKAVAAAMADAQRAIDAAKRNTVAADR